MVAASIRLTGDFDLGEECAQEAFSQAVAQWPSSGVPARPGAWLTTVARRRAIDVLRRQTTQRRLLASLVEPSADAPDDGHAEIPDDRLRLVFTCCHPALAPDAQVALTLRLLCGLTTAEVARAFLVSESTMAARITRAKKKIKTSHIPYRIPTDEDLPARVLAVLAVVYLVFTTGHTAPIGADLMRRDLVDRAKGLARMLRDLLPEDPEVAGLLALIVLTDARRESRTGLDGELLLLSDQDRTQWDATAIEEGAALVRLALRVRPAGRFSLMAAIAALHSQAPSWDATEWTEIARLYELLFAAWPSPVVALNRAVAVGFAVGPAQGLAALDLVASDPTLATYGYLASARAGFLVRLDRRDEARAAYEAALALCENDVERDFLTRRLTALDGAAR